MVFDEKGNEILQVGLAFIGHRYESTGILTFA
jgi:hypothetical protein